MSGPQSLDNESRIVIPTAEEYRSLLAKKETQYDIEDIRTFLSRFELSSVLRSLSSTSMEMFGQVFKYVNGRAVAEFITPFLAIEAIRSSYTVSPYEFRSNDLSAAMDMAFGYKDFFQLEV